jgi:CPA1 family monovalent cation:H+ antiporter
VGDIEVLVFLLLAVALLAGMGLRSGVPYPVALVLGGLVIGLVPGLPSPELDPEIVFFVFLPPLLYSAAVTTSWPDLRAEWRPIVLLAVGLVLLTIAAVAEVAHLVMDIPWAAAFTLGAVLGPTDPVSAAAVLDRLGVTGHTKTVLEGESLVNDGTGLVAYKLALAAVATSAGSPPHIAFEFVKVAAGGIAIGLAAGWVFAHLRNFVKDPSLDVTLSVVTPFVAYVPAERLDVSGVLATVAAGVYIGARSLDIIEPGTRLRTLSFWESATFLLDGLLFVLIGAQVPSILDGIEGADTSTVVGYALLITAVVMVVRMAWMLVVPPLLHAHTPRAERIVIGWSGMRGGVSLAAALAIGSRFPDHDLVLFVAYAVIVLTLVVPGLTLAPLLRAVGLGESEEQRRRDAEARLRITHAALERLEDLAEQGAPEHLVTRLRERYEARLERLEDRAGGREEDHGTDVAVTARLLNEMIAAERDDLRRMRRERAYPAETLREIERELDLDESRLRARIRL